MIKCQICGFITNVTKSNPLCCYSCDEFFNKASEDKNLSKCPKNGQCHTDRLCDCCRYQRCLEVCNKNTLIYVLDDQNDENYTCSSTSFESCSKGSFLNRVLNTRRAINDARLLLAERQGRLHNRRNVEADFETCMESNLNDRHILYTVLKYSGLLDRLDFMPLVDVIKECLISWVLLETINTTKMYKSFLINTIYRFDDLYHKVDPAHVNKFYANFGYNEDLVNNGLIAQQSLLDYAKKLDDMKVDNTEFVALMHFIVMDNIIKSHKNPEFAYKQLSLHSRILLQSLQEYYLLKNIDFGARLQELTGLFNEFQVVQDLTSKQWHLLSMTGKYFIFEKLEKELSDLSHLSINKPKLEDKALSLTKNYEFIPTF